MNFRKFIAVVFLFFSYTIYAQFGAKNDIVKITLVPGQDKVHAGDLLKVAVKANIQESWHINSDKPNDDFLIPSKVVSVDEKFPIAKISYPDAHDLELGFSDKPVSVFQGVIVIGLLINIDKALPLGDYNIPIKLQYQSCNDQTCLPPASVTDTLKISVVDASTPVQNINSEIFSGLNLSETVASSGSDNSIASTLETSGIFLSLIFIFLGGLALNLTPCVYPLIPITIGYFGGQSEGSTGRLFLLGTLYVLGMALTYSVIGVVTSLSGAVFGTLLQNTFVIIGITFIYCFGIKSVRSL